MEGRREEERNPGQGNPGGKSVPDSYPVDLENLMVRAVERRASDLHLAPGMAPVVRINGELIRLDYPIMSSGDVAALLLPILEPYQQQYLEEQWELDLSYSIAGLCRFRGNIMRQRGTLAAAFRVVPHTPPEFDSLGLPPVLKDLCCLPRGLVLVTGPTGSGKTTTLAAMIDYINRHRRVNIVTIEEPIEFLHQHKESIIKQREVGTDTHSFAEALRHVLRHDPDVILIGEMRDLESISIALTAAETGHLVLSTLHTQTAALAVHRIVDVFGEDARNRVRQQLADSLQGIVAQQILPRVDNSGRVVAVELLLSTPAVRNMIREGKEYQLYTVIQTGSSLGMQTMDQALADLCLQGKITHDTAYQRCIDKVELERILARVGGSGRGSVRGISR